MRATNAMAPVAPPPPPPPPKPAPVPSRPPSPDHDHDADFEEEEQTGTQPPLDSKAEASPDKSKRNQDKKSDETSSDDVIDIVTLEDQEDVIDKDAAPRVEGLLDAVITTWRRDLDIMNSQDRLPKRREMAVKAAEFWSKNPQLDYEKWASSFDPPPRPDALSSVMYAMIAPYRDGLWKSSMPRNEDAAMMKRATEHFGTTIMKKVTSLLSKKESRALLYKEALKIPAMTGRSIENILEKHTNKCPVVMLFFYMPARIAILSEFTRHT